MIPLCDPKAEYLSISEEINSEIQNTLLSGDYVLGSRLEAFETAFARYVSASHCIGVGNGLDALTLSLEAVGIGPGDEVLVPAHTFVATWLAVMRVGATPVGVDVEWASANMNANLIREKITSKTRAIVPVHLYGRSCNLRLISAIAKENNIYVIEDAAQAHGATYEGQRVGGHGNVVAWSFYPTKNLGAIGDGGAITTNDSIIADRLRALRSYGASQKYRHDMIGYNSRLDEIQAAILSKKLRHLDEWNIRRREVALRYLGEISNPWIELPESGCDEGHVFHLFVIKSKYRDGLQRYLKASGISTLVHYPLPPYKQKAITDTLCITEEMNFPVADALSGSVLSLPIGPFLADNDLNRIIRVVNKFKPV